MSKRDLTLDRSRKKRVCECGGELKLLGVDYSFRPHARCLKCGKEHIGFEGTKEAYKDGCKRGYVYKCPVCHMWHVSSMRHEKDLTGRACDGRQR